MNGGMVECQCSGMQPSVIPRFAMAVFLVSLVGVGGHGLSSSSTELSLTHVFELSLVGNTTLSMIGLGSRPHQTPGNRCIRF